MTNLDAKTVIGIKKAFSQKSQRTYITYYCTRPFSNYECDNTDCSGLGVEEVQTSEDFPIKIGDVVVFYYGKAIGTYQPVTDYKMLKAASDK